VAPIGSSCGVGPWSLLGEEMGVSPQKRKVWALPKRI